MPRTNPGAWVSFAQAAYIDLCQGHLNEEMLLRPLPPPKWSSVPGVVVVTEFEAVRVRGSGAPIDQFEDESNGPPSDEEQGPHGGQS